MKSQILGIALCVLLCQGCATNRPPNMDSLLAEWRMADGEGVYIVADKLFSALVNDPNRFYAAMSTDSLGFNHFVVDLQSAVFTDFSDKVTDSFERKRLHAIERLQEAEIDRRFSSMNQLVITELMRIRTRHPD